MIQLTRLSGEVVVINSDLIERLEATPDTVITLTNGSCYVVKEKVPVVVGLVQDFRAEIFRAVVLPSDDPDAHPHLHLYGNPTVKG